MVCSLNRSTPSIHHYETTFSVNRINFFFHPKPSTGLNPLSHVTAHKHLMPSTHHFKSFERPYKQMNDREKELVLNFMTCNPLFSFLRPTTSAPLLLFHCCRGLIHSHFGNSLGKRHKAVWEVGVFAESSCSPAALVASQLLPPEQLTPSSAQRQDHKRKPNWRNLDWECRDTSVLVKSGFRPS